MKRRNSFTYNELLMRLLLREIVHVSTKDKIGFGLEMQLYSV